MHDPAQLVFAQTFVGQERADLVDHELVHALARLFDLLGAGVDRRALEVLPA